MRQCGLKVMQHQRMDISVTIHIVLAEPVGINHGNYCSTTISSFLVTEGKFELGISNQLGRNCFG